MASKSKMDQDTKRDKFRSMQAVDPLECPFREFRDSELGTDLWGLGPAAVRKLLGTAPKLSSKSVTISLAPITSSGVWIDDQVQPLPRSVRHYLHGWIRAEELAALRWEAEIAVYEESVSKMSVIDMQVSHAQVLLRSSFCRKALSACFLLERAEGVPVEHQNEYFSFSYGTEGWRPKYHIYSPGMKPGGGTQHRPFLSKNGCYLVRLYYLGAWRCVWVSDMVPVDTSGAPLLPFSPLLNHQPGQATPAKVKGASATVTSNLVQLWPLLLCKALLKLAAPDMNSDEDIEYVEDEDFPELSFIHTLSGGMSIIHTCSDFADMDALWEELRKVVPSFAWDDDNETVASTTKSISKKPAASKKTTARETVARPAMVSALIQDTADYPPYALPGITPCLEMDLIVSMIRDRPLKKPLPEPIVPLWKTYRWVDWARNHGLYEAFECPRTKFIKVNGLMKLSHSPHLLDVQSAKSISIVFKEELEQQQKAQKKGKDTKEAKVDKAQNVEEENKMKEELREWMPYAVIYEVMKSINIIYFTSMFTFASCGSSPPLHLATKAISKSVDVAAPKSAPLYVSIDSEEPIVLRMSINALHPRIIYNNGRLFEDYVEKTYFILEEFEWFVDKEVPRAKGYAETRGYESVGINFNPGRHFCRLWVHSRLNWHISMISEANIILGTRDIIQGVAVKECPWVHRYLNILGNGFLNWIRIQRDVKNIVMFDREFFACYQPDLDWDPKVTGYNKCFVHWMFRQALQSILFKRLSPTEYKYACSALRGYFLDPDFGFPPKHVPLVSLKELAEKDLCDCLPESDTDDDDDNVTIDLPIMLGNEQKSPRHSTAALNICDLATDHSPCAGLRHRIDKAIRRHEAAKLLQAHWRGTWARKVVGLQTPMAPEVQKMVLDNAFGNLDALAYLMDEFFLLYPGTKSAYSISLGLSGSTGLQQHSGTSPITFSCKWIPYFQGLFYCHAPVKVHFDVRSNLVHNTVAVYNNDTGEQLPQAYNAHVTFHIEPNVYGYTVMGHGSLNKASGYSWEAYWQLSILSSIDNVFHICDKTADNEYYCNELPLTASTKLRLDEFFKPNRRNILGGVQISVTKIEAVSFRVEATSPDLEMEAVLKTTTPDGEEKELGRCHGTGELWWPYIRLKPAPSQTSEQIKSFSHAFLPSKQGSPSQAAITARASKSKAKPSSAGAKEKDKVKSATILGKVKETKPVPIEPKVYTIEVIAPNGWALSLDQWRRVVEVENSLQPIRVPSPTKKKGAPSPKDKKDKKEEKEKEKEKDIDKQQLFTVAKPEPGDAFVILECCTALNGGAVVKRDDERDILLALERRSWEIKDPGRNARGELIRQAFMEAYCIAEAQLRPSLVIVKSVKSQKSTRIVVPPPQRPATLATITDDTMHDDDASHMELIPGPTPFTESDFPEYEHYEAEDEASFQSLVDDVDLFPLPEKKDLYFTLPEKLKDKFDPLYFVPLCTRPLEECVLVTPEIAEAAMRERKMRLDAAVDRTVQLQAYNVRHVLGRQKRRRRLLETLYIDAEWNPEIATVLEERDEAIDKEILDRQLSAANKKKAEAAAKALLAAKEVKAPGKR